MITINLLPPERRRKEKTPLPRFLIILVGTGVVFLLLIWNVYLVWQNRNLHKMLDENNKTLQTFEGLLAPFADLQLRRTHLLIWEKVAETVEKSRPFKWWEVIDSLLDILEKYPKIWISSLRCETMLEGKKIMGQALPVEAIISFTSHYASDITYEGPAIIMTDFRKELKINPEIQKIFHTTNLLKGWELRPLNIPDAKEEWEILFNIELYRLKKIASKPVGK